MFISPPPRERHWRITSAGRAGTVCARGHGGGEGCCQPAQQLRAAVAARPTASFTCGMATLLQDAPSV
eukprot:6202217-Pleurochrysis_carterae.AAC.3